MDNNKKCTNILAECGSANYINDPIKCESAINCRYLDMCFDKYFDCSKIITPNICNETSNKCMWLSDNTCSSSPNCYRCEENTTKLKCDVCKSTCQWNNNKCVLK